MAQIINEFLTWCGLNYEPQTVGELLTWFVGIVCVFSLLFGVIKTMYVTSVQLGKQF